MRQFFTFLIGLIVTGAILFIWSPVIGAAWHWSGHRTTIVAGRTIRLPFLWSSDGLWYPTLNRAGTKLTPWFDSVSLNQFRVIPGETDASRRQLWRDIVNFKPDLEGAVKTDDPKVKQALSELSARMGRKVPYSLLPGWECVKTPALGIKPMIWVECLSPDSRSQLRYAGRSSDISDVKRIAEQLQ